MDTGKVDVTIIGAGLTGLTAAFYLRKKGLSVVIVEKNNRTGGVIETIKENGFVYEAGPNTGVVSHPEVAELFEELAPHCRLEVADPRAKRRLIWKSGRWHALPDGLIKAIKTPLFTLKDKFGILGEPFRKKGSDPLETLDKLVLRRMGRSYLEYAVDPFISGIYAGNPSYLVTRYALPKLYALEQNYGSFIGGAVKKGFEPADERIKKATKEVFSAEGGLGSLVKALDAAVGKENIWLNAKNTTVAQGKNGYEIVFSSGGEKKKIESEYVISTTEAGSLQSLFTFLMPEELAPVTNLEYARVTQVVLGFKNWQGSDLNAFGGLVPGVEKRNILGVLFTSSFFKDRTPENGALLSVFLGGTKRPDLIDLNDEQVKELVFNEIKEMFGLVDPDPQILKIFRYRHAIPQYGTSSVERLAAIDKIQQRNPGLILAGGIRDGIGMADRIKQARMIAGSIAGK